MSRETEREAITTHFVSVWNPADGRVAYPNFDFETPKNEMFVVFSLVDRGTTRESLGSTYLKKMRGTLQLDIYSPADTGTAPSRIIAGRLEEIYDSLTLMTSDGELINFYTPSAAPLATNVQRAANLDDNWSRYVVECPYTRQKIEVR